jgi:hypothetical protein
MKKKVRSYLIELARRKQTCYYQQLCDDCKLGLVMRESEFARAEIGRILGAISEYEHKNERPLLSALVISKGDNYQGDGFYKLAEELGFGKWQKLKKDISFEIGQMNACYEFWDDNANYELHK